MFFFSISLTFSEHSIPQVLYRNWYPTQWSTGHRSPLFRTLSWCGSCSVFFTVSMTHWESWSGPCQRPMPSALCPYRTQWSYWSAWDRSVPFLSSRWARKRRGLWFWALGGYFKWLDIVFSHAHQGSIICFLVKISYNIWCNEMYSCDSKAKLLHYSSLEYHMIFQTSF